MTLPMIGGDFFTRDFTVWPKVMNNNGYPGASFGDPVLMKCWFKAKSEYLNIRFSPLATTYPT
jgi:hypothetical protein